MTPLNNTPKYLKDRLRNWRARARTRLLYEGADVNRADDDGRTPLFFACQHGHVDRARNLLDKGAAVDRAQKQGVTPLYIACQNGHVDAARLLLDNGAEVDRAKENGETPLGIAFKNGHVDVAQLLLEKGADVNRANRNGETPLWIASRNMQIDAARLLLDKGADVDRPNRNGVTPLLIACLVEAPADRHGYVDRDTDHHYRRLRIDMARLLLEHGADGNSAFNWRYPLTSLYSWAMGIRTPLEVAQNSRFFLGSGHLTVFDELVELIQEKERQRHQEGTVGSLAFAGALAFGAAFALGLEVVGILAGAFAFGAALGAALEVIPATPGSGILHSVVMTIWESLHWLGALGLISAFLILAYEVIQSKINEINTQIEAHRSRSRRRGRERNALAARLREANAGCAALRAELAAAATASTEEEAARNAQIAELRTNVTMGAAQIAELERSVTNSTAQAARRRRQRDALAARLREANAGRDALTAELAAAAAARNAQIAELERSLSDSTPECCYCMSAQATMSFVHGETAHLAACAECAMNLAVQGHREICPICRAPFERIVKQFRG